MEIDENIRLLVDVLNDFSGFQTVSSCGGHEKPETGCSWPAGSWYVSFKIDRSDQAWLSLEFLAWLVNHEGGMGAELVIDSPPPYLNIPGDSLRFVLEGRDGEDPEALARLIVHRRDELFPVIDEQG